MSNSDQQQHPLSSPARNEQQVTALNRELLDIEDSSASASDSDLDQRDDPLFQGLKANSFRLPDTVIADQEMPDAECDAEERKEALDRIRWTNQEAIARTKHLKMLRRSDLDSKRCDLVEAFMERNSDRFFFQGSAPNDKAIKLAVDQIGCTTRPPGLDDVCPTCGSCFATFGQFAGTKADSLPACFSTTTPLFCRKRTAMTLLMPVLPRVEFEGDYDPFYIRTKVVNPAGITLGDLYDGMHRTLILPLSEYKLNVCLRYIEPFVRGNYYKEFHTHPRDVRLQQEETVRFQDDEDQNLCHLVDVPFYRRYFPETFHAFKTDSDEVFVMMNYGT